MIAIIDYGMGNIRSVHKACERINVKAEVTNNTEKIIKSKKIIIPGVGHFKKGMEQLKKLGLIEVLNHCVLKEKKFVLGICLGMQLFTKYSMEGGCEGLGWIDAETIYFKEEPFFTKTNLKVPHIGWNSVIPKKINYISSVVQGSLFYFIHSYFVKCYVEEDILFETEYGIKFHSGFMNNNIIGVQFHPEKSHEAGLEILRKFATL